MTQLLPNGKQQFTDNAGRPLLGGKVYFYSVGTQTPKNTYRDAAETVLNTNPVILDARGSASIYGSGAYRQVLRDVFGAQIWDQVILDPAEIAQNSIEDIANTTDSSKGSSLVGYKSKYPNSKGYLLSDRLGAIVFVKDFGPKGDGVSDDAESLKNALSSGAKIVDGRGVGTMLINEGVSIPDGVTLVNASIKAGAGLNIIPITMGNRSRLKDCIVDGNRATQTLNKQLIQISGKVGARVSGCTLFGSTLAGVTVSGGSDIVVEDNEIYDHYCIVLGGQFGFEATGIIFINPSSSGNSRRSAIGNTIYDCGQFGVDVRVNANDVLVDKNSIYNIGVNGKTAIGIQTFNRSDRTVITSNKLRDIPKTGVTTNGWMISLDQSMGAVCQANTVDITAANCPYGIEVVACQSSVIIGNTVSLQVVSTARPEGIIVNRSSFCTISNNNILTISGEYIYGIRSKGQGLAGLDISDYFDDSKTSTLGCYRNNFTGNTIRGSRLTIDNYTYGTIISGNTIEGKANAIQILWGDCAITSNYLYNSDSSAGVGNACIFLTSTNVRNTLISSNRLSFGRTAIGFSGVVDGAVISSNIMQANDAGGARYGLDNGGGSPVNISVNDNIVRGTMINGGSATYNLVNNTLLAI